jgi:hypothetical protein
MSAETDQILWERMLARMEQQTQRLQTLEREHRELQRRLCRLLDEHAPAQSRQIPASAPPSGDAPAAPALPRAEAPAHTSRRGMLKAALGVTAAAGAAALLESTGGTAAAATGSPLLAGKITTAETASELRYDGVAPLTGSLLVANDTATAATTASPYAAALGGWAGGQKAMVRNGIYGYTSMSGGSAVLARDVGSGGTGIGLNAVSASGTAVSAVSYGTGSTTTAVLGVISSTNPTGNPIALRGQNNSTNGNGVGVYGSHAGSGVGGYFLCKAGVGVTGSSTTNYGAYGASESGNGVGGYSSSGYGMFGSSDSGTGVWGHSSAAGSGFPFGTTGVGVAGTSEESTGVYGLSTAGTGVAGATLSTDDQATGVVGTVYSQTPGALSAGVCGRNNSRSFMGVGVYGIHDGSGMGIYGTAVGGSGVVGSSVSGKGVVGESTSGYGVEAYSSGGSALWAGTDSTAYEAAGVLGVVNSTHPGAWSAGVHGHNNGTGVGAGVGVWASHAGGGIGLYAEADAEYGIAMYALAPSAPNSYAIYANGDTVATGSKSAIVPAGDGTYRKLYCMESPECWFEDFGTAQLVGGAASVALDPQFAAVVHNDQYHIFLTPLGDCKGLFVNASSALGFAVRELQGGTSTLAFSYRLVARRKDVSAPRLAQVSMRPQMLQRPGMPAEVQATPRTASMQGVAFPTPSLPQGQPVAPTPPARPALPASLPPVSVPDASPAQPI